MFTTPNPSAAVQQWLDELLLYSFEVKHRPGILNVLPDALSRMYDREYSDSVWGIPSSYKFVEMKAVSLSSEGEDNGEPPLEPSITSITSADSPATSMADLQFEMEKRGKKIPPTQQERTLLIQKVHSLGHFGRDSIYRTLFDDHDLWWPGIRNDIQKVVSACDACARFVINKQGFKPSGFITAPGPWHHIQFDCITHLPQSPDGFTAMLIIVDVFTAFFLAFAILTTSAKCIAEKLWYAFSLFGLPYIVQSDNGPENANKVVQEVVKLMRLDHRFIAPWNPRTDGKVERKIGVVMTVIKKLLQGADRYWPVFVPIAQLCINSHISSLTQSTPFALMFARESHNLLELKQEDNQTEEMTIKKWKEFQERVLKVIYPSILTRILYEKEKMINNIDGSHSLAASKPSAFPIGAEVMRVDVTRTDKREPRYVGPYLILRKDANGNCILQDPADDSVIDRAVPPDQLKLRSPPSVGRDANDIYVVESILQHRGVPPNVDYLVKWKHYDASEATWEPPEHFNDTACIRKY